MKKKQHLCRLKGTTHCKIYKAMRLNAILLFGFVFSAYCNTQAQHQKIDLELKNASYLELFNEIKKQTGIRFLYHENYLEKLPQVNLEVSGKTVEEVLNALFAESSIRVEYDGNLIVLMPRPQEQQVQSVKVGGTVVDEKGLPIPGTTVLLKGTSVGTATNANGNFSMTLPVNSGVLIITSIGYESRQITFEGTIDTLKIVLKEDTQELDEVVVSVGYFNVDKRHLTSSITTLKAEDILIPGVSTIDNMLEGHIPGMIFMQNSGQVGATPKIKIRGTTTVLGNQAPLWVVDGEILTDPVNVDPTTINDLDFVNLLGNAISGLNPEDVEQIDVLKDASATAIYGPKASNGVIVITTKKGKPGPPAVSYSLSGTYRRRPHYSDRAVNVMNSMERVAYSRDLLDSGMEIPNSESKVGYESAYYDYYSGLIDHQQFIEKVRRMETVNTDWLGILMQNSLSHNHSLSISGGAENFRYYASLGYQNERGNIRGEENNRYSGRVNLNMSYDRFSMSFSFEGNVREKEYTPKSVGVMEYAQRTSRAVEAYNPDGSLWFYQKGTQSQYDTPFNIINEMNNTYDRINTDGFGVNINLGYKLIPSLRADVTFSYRISHTDEEIYYGEETNYIARLKRVLLKTGECEKGFSTCPVGGELRQEQTKSKGYSTRASLTFNKYLDEGGDHLLTANLIGELSSQTYSGFKITKRGYLPDRGMIFDRIDSKEYVSYHTWLLEEDARGKMKHNLTNQVALVGVVSYVYKNIYVLNANARIDASNKFGDSSNDRLLPIWSLSGRWNMHENLIKNLKWVNTVALKLSFGYQGNMSAQDSPNLIIKKQGIDEDFNEYYSLIQNYPNPLLKWEKTSNVNAELEYSLFNNKLRGTFTYYYRHTTDAFLNKQVSVINGVDNYTVNKGTLENRGFEFHFTFTPINSLGRTGATGKNGFVWRLDPNIGSVVNKLIDKIKPKDKLIYDNVTYGDYLKGKVLVGGRPVNTFYSYKFKGLNPENGAPLFDGMEQYVTRDGEDIDMNKVYTTMEKTDVYEAVMERSGPREPFMQGGISNYLGWGNWALSFNLAYSFGSKIRLLKLYSHGGVVIPPHENLRREHTRRWQKPGDELITDIPAVLTGAAATAANTPWWYNKPYKFADNYWTAYDNSNIRVVSGDYLKLSSCSLRYQFPKELCERMHLKSLYISCSGSNLFTLCSKKLKGQDPAQSGSSELINMSLRPTYTMQVRVTF